MKLNIFKKKQPTTPEPIPVCPTNQDKPECSLVQELRDIQEELSKLENDFYFKRKEILDKLYGKTPTHTWGTIYIPEEPIGILEELRIRKLNYTNIKGLTNIINLLQEYKDLTEKYLKYEQRKNELRQREAEIKEQLGIK